MPTNNNSTSQDNKPEGLRFALAAGVGDSEIMPIGDVVIPRNALTGGDAIGVNVNAGIGKALAMLGATACIALQKGLQGVIDGNTTDMSMEHITVMDGREINLGEVNGDGLHGDRDTHTSE